MKLWLRVWCLVFFESRCSLASSLPFLHFPTCVVNRISSVRNAHVICMQIQQAVVTSSASYNASIGRQFRDVIRPLPGTSSDLLDILRLYRQSKLCAYLC